MGKKYNWVCAAIAGSGSMLYGYDSAIIASTFGHEGFINFFNPSATVLGAIVSSYYGGVIVGLLFVSLLANRFGRKRTIQIGACIGLIGAILQTASQNIATFFVGRVTAGIAAGIMLTTVNVYQSEIAPPHLRGRMVSFQIVTLTSSGGIASWVGYASSFSSNMTFSWRFPIGLQCFPAVALILGCFYIPFSPRWLISKGRHEEARVILRRLHDDHTDSLFWEKEYLQIAAQAEVEAEEKATNSWSHMLTNWKELHRVLIAVAALTCVQTNGAQTIQAYQATLYSNLGFSPKTTLLMAGVFQVCLVIGGVINLILIDRIGRRFLFLFGLTSLSVCLGMFAAFSAEFEKTAKHTWGNAAIAMVMVFIFFFGATFNASPYAYAAEVLPTKIRANGMAIGLFCANGLTVMFTQTAPIALAKITWKFNLVFIACNIFFFPIAFFFFPETKGLSLEEVNAVFGDKVGMRLDEITDEVAEKQNVILTEHAEKTT